MSDTRVPKYIHDAIWARARAARILVHNDLIVSEWLNKHNVDCPYTELDAAVIVEPERAANGTLRAIQQAPSL